MPILTANAVLSAVQQKLRKFYGKNSCNRRGEIGRPGYPVETTKIDKEIIRLTGKSRPKLLFLPTASSDSEDYFEVVKKHFGRTLGCYVDVLYTIRENPSIREMEKKVFCSDIVYVGGGNTLKMMSKWRECGLDKILVKAYEKGIVLSGVSAGAVCWFRSANSDSRKMNNPDADYIKVRGLNLVNLLFCPHYYTEKDRKPGLKRMMKKTPGIAIAVDDCCALEIIDDKYRIVRSKSSANAYRVYWKAGKFYHEKIKKTKKFAGLDNLLKK